MGRDGLITASCSTPLPSLPRLIHFQLCPSLNRGRPLTSIVLARARTHTHTHTNSLSTCPFPLARFRFRFMHRFMWDCTVCTVVRGSVCGPKLAS